MVKSKIERFLRQKQSLWKKLLKLEKCLPGNLNAAYLICNRGNCKCTRGERHGPAWRLTWKENKKTKIIYIRKKEVKEVESGTNQYKKAKEILQKISFINLEILKLKREQEAITNE